MINGIPSKCIDSSFGSSIRRTMWIWNSHYMMGGWNLLLSLPPTFTENYSGKHWGESMDCGKPKYSLLWRWQIWCACWGVSTALDTWNYKCLVQ
jgi:hypothetical protein